MGNQLLIRCYNVGVGDCFYLRIPDGAEQLHLLIDCGSLGDYAVLKNVLAQIKQELPLDPQTNERRLDLLVATHKHEDHIKGFDPKSFTGITIKNIWMSVMMDKQHPQAELSQQLDQAATRLVQLIDEDSITNPKLRLLMGMFGINNQGAEKALSVDLPTKNRIRPRFVKAGDTAADLNFPLQDTKITVLAPENDIDFFYLGRENRNLVDGLNLFEGEFKPYAKSKRVATPNNISMQDFKVLQSRMLSSAFFFANESNKVINNSSVVLLIEWKNRRLLFVGDAEWDGKFAEGKRNGSWNVMWNQRKELLNKPLHFLKIGHHGSINATPWDVNKGPEAEVNQILNAILPLPANGFTATANAIVSTKRANYITIPELNTLVELGKRIGNHKNYKKAFADKNKTGEIPRIQEELPHLNSNQPQRSDFEEILTQKNYVEILINPG